MFVEFYTLPLSAEEALRSSAAPQPGGLFRKPTDTFFQALSAHGSDFFKAHPELAGRYPDSYPFFSLFTFLEQCRGIGISEFRDGELAQYLTKARGASIFVIRHAAGRQFLLRLEQALVKEEDLRHFIGAVPGKLGQLELMVRALSTLKACVAEVTAEMIGLMSYSR